VDSERRSGKTLQNLRFGMSDLFPVSLDSICFLYDSLCDEDADGEWKRTNQIVIIHRIWFIRDVAINPSVPNVSFKSNVPNQLLLTSNLNPPLVLSVWNPISDAFMKR